MTPRRRKVSDEEVFAATARAMSRSGPGSLSLADIAREAGLTPSALVQRFGSKRDLLLAVMERWADGIPEELAGFRRPGRSPLAVLRHYAECIAAMGESPAALANHLAYLQMDLTDPDFRRHMLRAATATRGTFRSWLEEAVGAGELAPDTDVAGLARMVETTLGGSLLNWAVYQEGTAAAWVWRDLDALLAPHRLRRPRPTAAPPRA
jgi:AcrR family transcriptional regulator